MRTLPAILLVIVMGLAGCLQAEVTTCPDGTICPQDRVCGSIDGVPACLLPEQIAECEGEPEGADCSFAGGTAGTCVDGVCVGVFCGNGLLEIGEECDGAELGDFETCSALGYYRGGAITCRADCRYDRTGCDGVCGDDTIDVDDGESCELGGDLGGLTCLDVGYYDQPGLSCNAVCGLDASGCTGFCGDGIRNSNSTEICDGAPAPGESCLDYGYDVGRIGCSAFCGPGFADCGRTGWTRMTSGNINGFDAIWAASATDAWAVDFDGSIHHWDGAAWAAMSTGASWLQDLWGRAGDDLYAVGNGLYHWNGAAWSVVSGAPGGVSMWGAATGELFLVGPNGTASWWNGTAWASPPTGTVEYLYDVWGAAPDDVFAVGYGGVIRHWDGDAWSTMDSGTTAPLEAVWGTATDDVWAGGRWGTLLHWDGVDWTQLLAPTPHNLHDFWGTGPDDVFCAGGAGEILHWDGAGWTSWESGTSEWLQGITGAADGALFAAGNAGTILQWSGVGWAAATTGELDYLVNAWRDPAGDLYAVGSSGKMIRWDGAGWTEVADGSTAYLYGISGTGPDDIHAVGDLGTLLHKDATGWTTLATPTTSRLDDVWAVSPSEAFAAGEYGTILRWDGADWTSVGPGGFQFFSGVWGSAPGDVYVVGTVGMVLHWNGAAWSTIPSGTSAYLQDVWGSGPDDIFAVGLGGAIVHFDGTSWKPMTSGVTGTLNAVSGSGPADVFAMGTGILLHYDGVRWSPIDVAGADLRNGWGGAEETFLVGGSGYATRLVRRCVAAEAHCADGFDDDCDGAVDCGDPDCDAVEKCTLGGLCKIPGPIACGETRGDDNFTGLARVDDHPCAPRAATGPEVGFRFIAPASGNVTVTLDAAGVDLDVIVAGVHGSGACDPGTCLAAGSTTAQVDSATFAATAGETYTIIVDGYDRAVGNFTVTVSCP